MVGALHTGSGKNDHFVMTQYGDVAGTLRARADSSPNVDGGQNVLCMGSQQGRAAVYENLSPTVTSAAGTSGNNQPVVCMESAQGRSVVEVDQSPTLNASHEQPIVIDRAAFNQGKEARYPPHIEQTDLMDTLVARGPHAVCVKSQSGRFAQGTTRESGAST